MRRFEVHPHHQTSIRLPRCIIDLVADGEEYSIYSTYPPPAIRVRLGKNTRYSFNYPYPLKPSLCGWSQFTANLDDQPHRRHVGRTGSQHRHPPSESTGHVTELKTRISCALTEQGGGAKPEDGRSAQQRSQLIEPFDYLEALRSLRVLSATPRQSWACIRVARRRGGRRAILTNKPRLVRGARRWRSSVSDWYPRAPETRRPWRLRRARRRAS